MATFRSFEDIEAWQKARELTKHIYVATRRDEFSKDFGLKDQIRRASVSIISNIAEGFDRSGTGEFLQFVSVAKGSAGEVKAQLFVALDLGYIDRQIFDELFDLATRTGQLLGGLMTYLRETNIKGTKYIMNAKPETRNPKR